MQRRNFLKTSALIAGSAAAAPALGAPPAPATAPKYTHSLKADAIGVAGNPLELLDLAVKHGFTALSVDPTQLLALSANQRAELGRRAKGEGIAWGTSGLPVQFREDAQRLQTDLETLRRAAAALAQLGVDRVATWIYPGRNDLTYSENMAFHAERLSPCADVLREHGQRLGLEYVGTPSLRNTYRYHFVSNSRTLRELIAAIGTDNVGVVLDSFHWYVSGEDIGEIESWTNDEVIAVDLNDAMRLLSRENQVDTMRELPGASGKIDIATFMAAIDKIGYDGPVRAEPFNDTLNRMENDLACAAAIASMRRLID